VASKLQKVRRTLLKENAMQTMSRLLLMSAALLAVLCVGCGDGIPEGHFPCGNHGGSCEIGKELCVVENQHMCSTCIPIEPSCSASEECGCIEGIDSSFWDGVCADAPQCEASGEGLLVRCTADDWSCG
jgi:hypothetical protein